MTRIVSHHGVSWLAHPINRVPTRQRESEEMGIACRRCIISRARFHSLRHALADGWRRIERWKWHTEPFCNFRGLCPVCRTHPEEE